MRKDIQMLQKKKEKLLEKSKKLTKIWLKFYKKNKI